jgi:hypothetical protein
MYRWLENYEQKHAEMMRVIKRFRHDSKVWAVRADRREHNGAVTFGHMQTTMYKRLQHNTVVLFKSVEWGAHRDWVSAITFDEFVTKVDGWCNAVFKWMDKMVGQMASWMDYVLMTKAGDIQGVQGFLDISTQLKCYGTYCYVQNSWRSRDFQLFCGTTCASHNSSTIARIPMNP